MTTELQSPADQQLAGSNLRTSRDRQIAALASHGAACAIITFDGYGDEGQIQEIAIYDAAGNTLELPDLGEDLENFTYDILGDRHGDWQDNDGAYGTITIDVAEGTGYLDFNARFTSVDNSYTEL